MARGFAISVKKNSSSSFLVKVTREKETPLEFVVDLNNKQNLCSCCYDKYMGGPCIHVLLCLKNVNKLKDSASFFHPLWKASTFKEAYNEEQHCHIRPFVVKQELETNDCNPPTIKKKRSTKEEEKRVATSIFITESNHEKTKKMRKMWSIWPQQALVYL